MSEKKGEYQALRQTLDGIMGGSTPQHELGREATESAAACASITINGGTVIINTGPNATNHLPVSAPKSRTISPRQAAWLRSLVYEIVRRETQTNPGFRKAKVWFKLNETLGVLHYKDIPMSDFDRAKEWLDDWLMKLPS